MIENQKTSEMKIVQVPIGDLKPAEYNPRKMDEKQVKDLTESIKEFGLVDPLIVNNHKGRENVVIGGHQRLKIASILGFKTIPVVYVDLEEKRERELNLRLNRNLGEWDYDLLANFSEEELNKVGFLSEELDKIFQLNTGEDDFDAEAELEKIKEPKIKLGDLYQLEKHRLLCGDSTKKEDVEKLMEGVLANMVFTDPPYGIDLDTDYASIHKGHLISCSGKHNKVKGDEKKWDFQKSNWFNCEEQFWWGADYYLENKNQGSWFVWDKTCGRFIGRIGNEFELCWSRRKHKREIIRIEWVGYNNLDTQKREHPTQKPVKLAKWFIEKFSKRGQNIIDLFGGSGSTLIACEQLNRKCYMCEIDPKYVEVIINRWEKLTQSKAKKIQQ